MEQKPHRQAATMINLFGQWERRRFHEAGCCHSSELAVLGGAVRVVCCTVLFWRFFRRTYRTARSGYFTPTV